MQKRVYNLKKAFLDVFGFTEADWSKIMDLQKSAIEDAVHYPSIEHSFHKILLNLPTLITCDLISVLNNLKASFNSPSVKQYKKYLEDKVPHCCSFLLPWIEGYYEVKKGNFKCAVRVGRIEPLGDRKKEPIWVSHNQSQSK
ncbi:hypothetical protein [Sphaerochaeta globosa]|uniref:hypothetical protein n=1 Tax=Sphaerochaeta globosa TaxID=1131703 RepID=UPI00059B6882|nr:hypothetical protein [Sphaerochaeta globosa]